jgi:hypothetical protein
MFSENQSPMRRLSIQINTLGQKNPDDRLISIFSLNASYFRRLFMFNLFVFAFICLSNPSPGLARDCWISVHGAGRLDGTSPDNAYAVSGVAQKKSVEKCWAETSADGTMYVLEGRYEIASGTFWNLSISKDQGGSDKDLSVKKKLIGLGRVSIVGSRKVPYDPALKESGETWLEIKQGAHGLHIENFYISRVAIGILADSGGNRDLSFKDLRFQDTRQNLILFGHPDCSDSVHCKNLKKESISSRIRIEKVNGLRYSKRHIRLTHGIFDVRVLDSFADSQFLDGDFAVGFDVENPSHDISFRGCIARRNLYKDSIYWNGDGFKSENETKKIRWIRCAAFDNADAGFDIKSPAAFLDHVNASGNGRNIRIWSQRKTRLKHIFSTNARRHGGEGAPSGLWIQGIASCQDCTIFGNPTQIHLESDVGRLCRLTLIDSFITAGKDEALVVREDGAQLQKTRTKMWKDDTDFDAEDTAKKSLGELPSLNT